MSIWSEISAGLWNPWLFILFFITGCYFSVQTGFFQLFGFPTLIKRTLGSLFQPKEKTGRGKLSQFQAMATALGATIGTSSIAGVSAGIYFGGPGAVFWMWLSALLGMMTGYAEKVMAIQYRHRNAKGDWEGGPMEYMTRGLDLPFLAGCFACACLLGSLTGGNMVQASSISAALGEALNWPTWQAGLVTMVCTGLVIWGGIGRIGKVSSALVPVMALLFLGGGIWVIAAHSAALPGALESIFTEAFRPKAALGGGVGYTISSALRYGIARGVFTNEAGMGSSSMAHANAQVQDPDSQGLWGMLEVFLATLVISTVTALVILTAGVYQPDVILRATQLGVATPELFGVPLVVRSFATVFGDWAGPFLAVCLVLFAFSSLLGWCYYGERCVARLSRVRGGKFRYRVLFLALIFLGSQVEVTAVWEMADLCNGLMALPNLLALLLLSPQVLKIWRDARGMPPRPKSP